MGSIQITCTECLDLNLNINLVDMDKVGRVKNWAKWKSGLSEEVHLNKKWDQTRQYFLMISSWVKTSSNDFCANRVDHMHHVYHVNHVHHVLHVHHVYHVYCVTCVTCVPCAPWVSCVTWILSRRRREGRPKVDHQRSTEGRPPKVEHLRSTLGGRL